MAERVMAVFNWTGDTDELRTRYDAVLSHVVAVSPARPIVHLASDTDTGFRVVDVWDNEQVCRAFLDNEAFHQKLAEHGLGEAEISVEPVYNLGWPVSASPLYR